MLTNTHTHANKHDQIKNRYKQVYIVDYQTEHSTKYCTPKIAPTKSYTPKIAPAKDYTSKIASTKSYTPKISPTKDYTPN